MLLLKQDTIRKRQVDNNTTKLEIGNDKSGKYKVRAICDSAVYARKLEGYLLGLYYLIFWKSYLKERNNTEPYSVVWHLKRLICLFHKNHLDKLIAIFKAINIISLMARPTIKPITKSATKLTKIK